jgi:6-pyruvoyltetrahydropterin/6-carboxytetrahydropterin synthase
VEISKEFTFEAAHRLPNVPVGHKCARLHGHSYRITLVVKGPVQKDTGWVMDFAQIREAFEPIRTRLDHYYLNEIEGLQNPTSENLSIWIWTQIKPQLRLLSKVIVMETCTSAATYDGHMFS